MATMRQELIKALTGVTNLDKIPSTWSPNMVKAIVLTRDYVIVVNHMQQPRVFNFNAEEAYAFISANGGKGKLQNVLTNRTLSCLEEIYVDSLFKEYSGAFNLSAYISQLQSNVSRLRYFGYVENSGDVDEFVNAYTRAVNNGLKDYCYATDNTRNQTLEIYSTENTEWFKRYNLRPNDYKPDKVGGPLHTWFKSVEQDVAEKYALKLSEVESEAKSQIYKELVNNDLQNCIHINMLMSLKEIYASSMEGNPCFTVSNDTKIIVDSLPKSIVYNTKIPKEDLIEALKSLGKNYSKPVLATLRELILKSEATTSRESSLVNLSELKELIEKGNSTIINYEKYYYSMIDNFYNSHWTHRLSSAVTARRKGIEGIQSGTKDEVKVALKRQVAEGNYGLVMEYMLCLAGANYDSIINTMANQVMKGGESA